MKTDELFYKGEAKQCENCFFYHHRWILPSICDRNPRISLDASLERCQYNMWEPNLRLYMLDEVIGVKKTKRKSDFGVPLGYVPRRPPRKNKPPTKE